MYRALAGKACYIPIQGCYDFLIIPLFLYYRGIPLILIRFHYFKEARVQTSLTKSSDI